jgi:LysM repeat protein
MGQLERYGLYVLCIVISLILGIAIWGGDPPVSNAASRDVEPRRELTDPFEIGPKLHAPDRSAAEIGLPQTFRTVSLEPDEAPAPEPAPRVTPVALRTHKVAAGDKLEELAKRYLGSAARWPEIKRLNPGIDERNLRLGTELKIPEPGTPAKEPAAERTLAADEYRVVDGDNPARISMKLWQTEKHAQRLMEHNGITDARRLRVGSVLKVPKIDAAKSR